MRARSSHLLAAARLVAVLAWTAVEALVIIIEQRRACDEHERLRRVSLRMRAWARRCVALSGVRLELRGKPARGALLTPNHVSYGDILVLSAACGCSFVPKAELMDWPIVGPLMRLTGMVSVDRSSHRALHGAAEAVAALLRQRQAVAVFLEGTTTTNDRVLKYRPSFVQAALDAGAPIQPVALNWSVHRPGLSVERDVAYWGDVSFLPHFWRMLGLRGVGVRVSFGKPLPPAGSRKELAARARSSVVRMAGLPPELDEPAVPIPWKRAAG